MTKTVIKNTTIVTVNCDNSIIYDASLVVDGERIAALGPSDQIQGQFLDADVIDGRGKTVFPGLINAHTHLLRTSCRGILEDTGFPTTLGFPKDVRALMSPDQEKVFALLGAAESIRSGTTCILEIERDIPNYVESLERTGMRLALAEYVEDIDIDLVRQGEYKFIEHKADLGLCKSADLIESWDGRAGGRIICKTSPSTPEYCSPYLLNGCSHMAEKYDIGSTVHLSESYNEVQAVMGIRGVRPTQYLNENGALGTRVIAAHCRYLDQSEIELMGKVGANVSFNPAIAARRGAAAPVSDLEIAGCNIGMGTDNMDENMIHAMRTGLFAERVRLGLQMDPQPEQLLNWATVGSAQALGLSDEIGSLEVGKRADFFVADMKKPHLVPNLRSVSNFVHNGQAADVVAVMVDGNWLMRDGKLITIDEEELMDLAEDAGQHLWNSLADDHPNITMPFELRPNY